MIRNGQVPVVTPERNLTAGMGPEIEASVSHASASLLEYGDDLVCRCEFGRRGPNTRSRPTDVKLTDLPQACP